MVSFVRALVVKNRILNGLNFKESMPLSEAIEVNGEAY